MYKVMTYAAVVFQVLSSDIDETESGGGNTSEKTEQFCQIFGSAPQDKASGQDIQRDHQPVGNILSFEDLHQFISRLLKPGISGLQGQ